MELENTTKVPAVLWRTIIDDNRIAAAVVARITYRIIEGHLYMAKEQAWQISDSEYDSPIGKLPPEDCLFRGGIDLMIFGSAQALGAHPTQKVKVRIKLGNFIGGVDVYGERVWRRKSGSGNELIATEPEPFRELPLSLGYAYGGKHTWDGLEVPHTGNPDGKGWYYEEDSAVGNPLANIENPSAPTIRWTDQPDPVGVGLCPRSFGPRILRGVEFDEKGILRKIHPTFFNDAFPDMIAPIPAAGTRCIVSGVQHSGNLAFILPRLPLMVKLRIAKTEIERLLHVDQIGIEPDIHRVFVTYRYPFRYTVIRMEPRSCELRWAPT